RIRWFYFFFQAEDGIRDRNVTGVQTCALPICNISVRPSDDAQIRISGKKKANAWNENDAQQVAARVGVEVLQNGDGYEIHPTGEIGRASCRERGETWVGAGAVKKKRQTQ